MLSIWHGKLKVKIWPLITVDKIMLPFLNQQIQLLRKWMKEEQREYVSTVIASIVNGINIVRKNYST